MVMLSDLDRFHLVIDVLDRVGRSELTPPIPPGYTRRPVPPDPMSTTPRDVRVAPWAMMAVSTSIEVREPATDERAVHHA